MSESPVDFFRSHGLIVDDPIPDGRWHAVPTTDKPSKRNGRYMIDGDKAVCQNWAQDEKASVWKAKGAEAMSPAEKARRDQQRRDREETQQKQWARAAARAQAIVESCNQSHHGYSIRKGFGETERVLVTPEGAMFLPMRHLDSNELMGGQVIQWLVEERQWQKRFISGMRAKGAIFRLGPKEAPETIICEGWATGRSIQIAAALLHLRVAVLVAFSAGNIVEVAGRVKGRAFVFADRDASGAGQKAAEATGLPWTMSDVDGEDANDVHLRAGLRPLAAMVMELRRKEKAA